VTTTTTSASAHGYAVVASHHEETGYPLRRMTQTSKLGTAVPLERVMLVADFRASLRAFLRRSEQISQRQGLTPQRYLLLLMIKGAPDGSERMSFSDLAARLRLGVNTVTELVARAEAAGLVERERSATDARVTYLRLTTEGERRLVAAMVETDGDREALIAAFRALAASFDAIG
jgi:DNA-binding MarR family transcriptional regulator